MEVKWILSLVPKKEMPTVYQVLWVNKSVSNSPHRKIAFIGGINPNGTNWKITQEEAISGIECGDWSFYVVKDDQSVKVIVAEAPDGSKYLKTFTDGVIPGNLLSLPEQL